jgi:deoxyribonuclease V
MLLALDVHYQVDRTKVVGVLFKWDDKEPKKIVIAFMDNVAEYVPGEFYKRELPCLLKIIDKIDLNQLEAIIIDGYVYIDNNKNYGLGGILWETLNKQIPIIGVAKTSFFKNKETVIEVTRGESIKPLFVSAIGYDLELAALKIKQMYGSYRIPSILKQLDTETKM